MEIYFADVKDGGDGGERGLFSYRNKENQAISGEVHTQVSVA